MGGGLVVIRERNLGREREGEKYMEREESGKS